MSRGDQFVSLDRQFAELGDVQNADSAEDLALRSYVGRAMGVSSDLGWSAIYRQAQSCVVLGEAGSGKSREMQEQAKALRSTGVVAACIDLRDLLGSSLLLDSDPMLSAWRRGAAVAWFFLDSVDESKLTDVADFHRALKRMAVWVGADSRRARFVISSRISEWRPATDKRLVEEILLPAPSKLRVLALQPLSEAQARALLTGRGPVDERFFSDVEDADAWDFLHRPLDVSNLYALWQQQGRLGTLSEVVDHSITRLLQDPQRPALLAANRLREGAEHVAACLTFGKSVAALVPDSVLPDANDALHLRACLPQAWPDADVRLLAQCPLFDAAAYGKIRFHHRSYQTYLTASWLARLMRSDCPYAELRHLLFGQGPADQLSLRPSLDAVASWLACLNEGETHWQAMLRGDLLRHAPWVFFAHGDPRKVRRADQYTIEPGDLARLLGRRERVPRNRADLFHLATARLSKFKEEVESAEISIRRECGEHWTEPDFQDWFQRRLRAAANGLYTLSSETKIDPGKFLDLRFDAPGVDGAVSVEVKVATFAHWSYATLEERLKNQLVGQYLRAQNARHGVYLLIRAKADRDWQDHEGKTLLWPELLLRLQAVADAIVAERPDIDDVRVFGVDVTPPALASER